MGLPRFALRIFPVKSPPERSRATSRTILLLETAVLLTIVACVFAYDWRRFFGDKELGFTVLLIVPGTATGAYLFVGALVPNLVAATRMKWPLMVTLPVVYGALVQLCASLWTITSNPLVRQELFSRSSGFWQHALPAGVLLLCQMSVLAVWAAIASRYKRPE